MERFAVLSACITLVISPVLAESQSYGAPSTSFSSFGSTNRNNFNRNQDSGGYQSFRNVLSSTRNDDSFGSNIAGPKTFRHISLFIAPQEPDDQPRVRTIRPQQGPPDKHVNIIFVKAPSKSSSQTTEVELPPQSEQKTLVYVLVKKSESSNDVRIRGPAPTKPPAPEVYFIKYKDGKGAGNNLGSSFNNGGSSFNNGGSSFNNGGSSFNNGGVTAGAIPVRSSSVLSTSYGAP